MLIIVDDFVFSEDTTSGLRRAGYFHDHYRIYDGINPAFMFARLVAFALLFSIFGGGFVFGADASCDAEAAETSPIEAGSLRLESDSSANLWEFIRNSAADDDGNISVKPLLRTFLSWRVQLATPALILELSFTRPSGLVLLCERALQLRSGVLKA